MTIEKSLERIADALEFTNKYQASEPAPTPTAATAAPPPPVAPVPALAPVPSPTPPATPDPISYTEADLIAALEQFIPERKEEAMIIMNKFGVVKKSDVPEAMLPGLIQELNAVYHS